MSSLHVDLGTLKKLLFLWNCNIFVHCFKLIIYTFRLLGTFNVSFKINGKESNIIKLIETDQINGKITIANIPINTENPESRHAKSLQIGNLPFKM